jgi:uncharacterized membrane protein YcgQ (UPF0703/DUF1980 family)
MIFLSNDGRLTTSFASNRTAKVKTVKKVEKKEKKEEIDETKLEINKDNYDMSKIDFDIKDDEYYDLSDYITYITHPEKVQNKTIRVRGFTQKMSEHITDDYFAIGKYGVNCCTADAEFAAFIAKYDDFNVKDNTWYEIEGVLQKSKDKAGYDIMVIRIFNIKEIDSSKEEQYVYPCYAYGDGMCKQINKYNFED